MWVVMGSIALGVGIIGMLLPVLPTSPFLLASAYCYARGSKRCHDWLVNHRLLGPIMLQGEKGMHWALRLAMVAVVWAACAVSLTFFAREQWQQASVVIVGCLMTMYFAFMPRILRGRKAKAAARTGGQGDDGRGR
jgi:uncharacterized membrane protein YbaN (DUF454 family)